MRQRRARFSRRLARAPAQGFVASRDIEVFSHGCFSASLRKAHDVGFLADHDWAKCFGSTGDGSLQLHETDTGLAFALGRPTIRTAEIWLRTSGPGRFGMSVGYRAECKEERDIDGDAVTFVEKAILTEVSVVGRPAVKEAAITYTKASTFGGSADACRSGRIASLHAAGRFENSLAKLKAVLAQSGR